MKERMLMEFTYAEFQSQKEKRGNVLSTVKKISGVLSDIPIVGNTLKTSTDLVTDTLESRSEFAKAFGDGKKDSTYFVLNSNDYYGELFEKVFKILEIKEIGENFDFKIDELKVSIEEWFDDDFELIEEVLTIVFLDDFFVNDRNNQETYGTVYISFQERFKQINFEDGNVYSAFETLALGANHHQAKRDYCKLAELICHFLGNSKLLR